MLNPNIFNTLFVFPILNLLMFFYGLFVYFHIPGPFGFAIIALTVLIRLLLQPFFHQQMQTAKKMQELKPHLDNLSQKHKNDKKALQQEQLKLYQQAGINPASGCLFLIIQLPIFIALYQALSAPFFNKNIETAIREINSILYSPQLRVTTIDLWFFGFSLAKSPQSAGVWYYFLIPVLTAALQYLQVQFSQPQTTQPKNAAKKEPGTQVDFQRAMNTQMKYVFPVLIGWFSYTLPVGLSLYWNVFSIFSIIQYRKLKAR